MIVICCMLLFNFKKRNQINIFLSLKMSIGKCWKFPLPVNLSDMSAALLILRILKTKCPVFWQTTAFLISWQPWSWRGYSALPYRKLRTAVVARCCDLCGGIIHQKASVCVIACGALHWGKCEGSLAGLKPFLLFLCMCVIYANGGTYANIHMEVWYKFVSPF